MKISTLDTADSLYSYTWAIVRGEVTDIGTSIIEDHGILLSENTIPISSNSFFQPLGTRTNKGIFRYKYTGLKKNTQYYYRAVAYSNSIPIYGATKSLKTKDTDKPSLSTTAASDTTLTGAKSGGHVISDNGEAVTKRGLCWALTANPTIENCLDTTVNGADTGRFVSVITGLEQGKKYYARAYAINQKGTAYGNEISFNTLQPNTANTADATDLTVSSATLNGSVNAHYSDATVYFEYGPTTSYGLVIAASPSTVTGNSLVTVTAGITGLSQGTEYHFRVKAVSNAGTSYGNDLKFTTLILPSAVTGIVSGVSATSVILNGTVNANGSSTTVSFEYGQTTSYGSTVNATPLTVTGNTVTSVSASASPLTEGILYHYRIKAVSSAGTSYGNDFTFTPVSFPATVTDYDGNVYNTVLIGTQLWMKENLKVTRYNSGDTIGTTYPSTLDYSTYIRPKYQWSYYGNEAVVDEYGRYYTWYAATDTRGICPTGWHLPSDDEWTQLIDYLTINGYGYGGSGNDVARSLAANSTWNSYSTPGCPGIDPPGNNSSGFSGKASGYRFYHTGDFGYMGRFGWWWSSTEFDNSNANDLGLNYGDATVLDNSYNKSAGFSIRCLMGPVSLAEADDATSITSVSATLNGKLNPNGATSVVTFEYGYSKSYGNSVTPAESPVSGASSVNISCNLTSLQPGTTYHYRIKSVNSGGTYYSNDNTFTTDVADVDGNTYKTVTIGSQIWMKQNLNVSKLNDNTTIPVVTDNSSWSSLNTAARCYYNNDQPGNGTTYGALYNWFTVNTGKLCPAGWHVPDDSEFNTLLNALGGNTVAGGHLKEAGYGHWAFPNTGADNSSGFTALPAGHRRFDGGYINLGTHTYWWTTNPYPDGIQADRFNLDYDSGGASQSQYERTAGFSVRCIKD